MPGDLAPHHGRPLIGAFLRGTRDEDSSVRASCLSNLGELCQRLHFSLGPLAQEVTQLTITPKQSHRIDSLAILFFFNCVYNFHLCRFLNYHTAV